jgi:lysozyme
MQIKLTDSLRKKIAIGLIGVGVAGPSAYVATETTAPSEGFYLTPYIDPAGLKTICLGHLVQKGEAVKDKYTEDECITVYVQDWLKHEKQLDSVVKVPYRSEWMRGALTDFTFNKGIGNVKSSTLLKKLNSKDYDGSCQELSKWVYAKVNGVAKVLPGLVIRATKQYAYCMGNEPGDYKTKMSQWQGGKVFGKETETKP